MTKRHWSLLLTLCALLALPVSATAHPEVCGKEQEAHEDGEMCFTEEQIAAFDDSGANLAPGETARSQNMHLLANLPKSGPFAGEAAFNSDIAFWGKYAFQGNYNGFQITDISSPGNPKIVSQVNCPGSQTDISVWKNLVILSTDSRRSDNSCNSFALTSSTTPSSTDPNAEYWEGIKVFDWSDPSSPKLVTAMETDCGSHTHTILPQGDRMIVYVSSYDLSTAAKDCRLTSTPQDDHDKISIVEFPMNRPQDYTVTEKVLFPDGGFAGTSYTRQTRGCHDITVYPAMKLAAGACMGEGVMMDISDPRDPKVISSMRDNNFAFWHSATFSNDATKVIFTDELGGGGGPTCNPTIGPEKGADAIYDVNPPVAPIFLSYFKIGRTQSNTENCVAHNGNVLPTADNDVFVQSWYQGGTSVIDFTDASKPREVAFFDRGPIAADRLVLGGHWSSYYYNGFIFGNEIQRGLDVMKFSDPLAAKANGVKLPYLNAQVQEPLTRR